MTFAHFKKVSVPVSNLHKSYINFLLKLRNVNISTVHASCFVKRININSGQWTASWHDHLTTLAPPNSLVLTNAIYSTLAIPLQISYESLSSGHLELKLSFCEELERAVDVLEGSLSRTKGFIIISYLKTIEHLKTKNIAVNQVTLILPTVATIQVSTSHLYFQTYFFSMDFNSHNA